MSGHPGMGVMINGLWGDRGGWFIKNAIGKTISDLVLKDNRLCFDLSGGSTLELYDDGQSCCEHRYMRTDDDLPYFIGAELKDVEIKSAENEPDKYGEHEVEFLVITTSKGVFTMANHNEHNGYYGGFYLKATGAAPTSTYKLGQE